MSQEIQGSLFDQAPQVYDYDADDPFAEERLPASFEYVEGDIFDSGCEVLINPVNCCGSMGRGLAKEFKRRSSTMLKDYKQFCKEGSLTTEKPMWGQWDVEGLGPQTIILFATKYHWDEYSDIECIKNGLECIKKMMFAFPFKSIAFPALGCGEGGLDWDLVRPLLEEFASSVFNCHLKFYVPHQPSADAERPVIIDHLFQDAKALDQVFDGEPEPEIECAVPDCSHLVSYEQYMCPAHFRLLPKESQDQILASFGSPSEELHEKCLDLIDKMTGPYFKPELKEAIADPGDALLVEMRELVSAHVNDLKAGRKPKHTAQYLRQRASALFYERLNYLNAQPG